MAPKRKAAARKQKHGSTQSLSSLASLDSSHIDPSERQPPSPPSPRKDKSCAECRRRKVRCCGERPACTQCKRRSLASGFLPDTAICVYPDTYADPVMSAKLLDFHTRGFTSHQPTGRPFEEQCFPGIPEVETIDQPADSAVALAFAESIPMFESEGERRLLWRDTSTSSSSSSHSSPASYSTPLLDSPASPAAHYGPLDDQWHAGPSSEYLDKRLNEFSLGSPQSRFLDRMVVPPPTKSAQPSTMPHQRQLFPALGLANSRSYHDDLSHSSPPLSALFSQPYPPQVASSLLPPTPAIPGLLPAFDLHEHIDLRIDTGMSSRSPARPHPPQPHLPLLPLPPASPSYFGTDQQLLAANVPLPTTPPAATGSSWSPSSSIHSAFLRGPYNSFDETLASASTESGWDMDSPREVASPWGYEDEYFDKGAQSSAETTPESDGGVRRSR